MAIYVNMVDRFMSGWGGAAGGVSRYSVKCDTREQADAIEKAAQDRSEMKYVTLALTPPRKRSAGDHVQIVDFKDMGKPWLAYWRGE
jgi:hypothetical protein